MGRHRTIMGHQVLALLIAVAALGAAKDTRFLSEEMLSRVLDDGYCQGYHTAGLTEDECKQTKWDELVKIIANLMSNCIALKTGDGTDNPLAELSKNSTWLSANNLRALIIVYVDTCLGAEKVKSSPKYSRRVYDPCTSSDTRNLTEWWRQDDEGSNIKPNNGGYNCDKDLQNNKIWFRLQGEAGDHLADSCMPQLSCGSHGGFWSDAEMPSKVGETWHVPVYGSLNRECKWYTWTVSNPLTVKRCSEKEFDFVYKLRGTEECHWTVCGTD